MADQLAARMPLAQQLNDMVKNFTLLDILSKEEQEDLLSSKIDQIRRQNEERLKRHQEIEEDRMLAAGEDRGVKPAAVEAKATSPSPPSQNSPLPLARTLPQGDRHNGSSSPQDNRSPQGIRDEKPQGMRDENPYTVIQLQNEGRGLGFGLVGKKGIGVVVKTIVADGAAAKDGRLQPDDMMMFVNGICVMEFTRDEIVDLLIAGQKKSSQVTLQIARGAQQISSAKHRSPPGQVRSGHGPRHIENVYEANADRKMEFTVINDQYTKAEPVPNRRVSEGVCGKDIIVTLGKGDSGGNDHMTRVTEIIEHKTLNVEVDFKGHQRAPADQRVPGNPAQNPREEWSERRKQNIDRVEAEILAMREQYENQKQHGAVVSLPHYGQSTGSFLNDPSRNVSDDASQRTPNHRDGVQKQQGSRRSQHSYGGSDFEDTASLMAKQKGQQRQQPPRNIDISMTGKERKRYENWKKEREEIDEQRLARHKNATGEWKREWDKEKIGKCQNERKPKPVKGRILATGNDSEEVPTPSWGRGRGRGRGLPKIDPQFNNELKYSKIVSTNKKKLNESKREMVDTTDDVLPPPPSVDSFHGAGGGPNEGAEILTGSDPRQPKSVDGAADGLTNGGEILTGTGPKLRQPKSIHGAGDVSTEGGEIFKGSDPRQLKSVDRAVDVPTEGGEVSGSNPKLRQSKTDLHIDIPDPEQAAITSPGTFKTPPGFKYVVNWAEEMDKLDPVNEL